MDKKGYSIGAGILLLGVSLGTFSFLDEHFDKEAKSKLDNAIVKTLDNQGCKIASVDTDYFDWSNKDSDYFFRFTGSAMNFDNEKIDFFSAVYKVDEQTYKDTLTSININCHNRKTANNLSSRSLVQNLAKQVKKSQLMKVNINENIAIKGIDSSNDFADIDNSIILNVSKPIINAETVSYKVVYAQGIRTKQNGLGLVTSLINVVFDKTEELAQNPAKVFSKQSLEPAKIEVLDRAFSKMRPGECIRFEEDVNTMEL